MADFSASPDVQALDTERILATLAAHGVEYVLVGGVACLMHGSTRVTVDADLVPAASPENLARLVEALRTLGAAVFVPRARMRMEAGEPWEVVALRRGPEALLEADAWHFTTDAGPIDVVLDAAGVGGYEDHLGRVETREVFGIQVKLAGLDDLIRSKETLNRDKDAAVLQDLYDLRARSVDE